VFVLRSKMWCCLEVGRIEIIVGSYLYLMPRQPLAGALLFAAGAVALLDLALYFALGPSSPFAALGIGGLERWVAYPIILWTVGFGGHRMGLGP